MKLIDCPRCESKNTMSEDTAVLNNGRKDTAWSCFMCGHVTYGEVDEQKSRREQRRRLEHPEPYRFFRDSA